MKLKKIKKPKATPKLCYDSLVSDQGVRKAFLEEVKKKFEVESTSGGSKWDSFREAMTSTASEEIPVKEKKSRNKWLTREILDLMKKRQKISHETVESIKTWTKISKKGAWRQKNHGGTDNAKK